MDTPTANKIAAVVMEYQTVYADEFAAFKQQKKAVSDALRNEFASGDGTTAMERELFRLPETLFAMLKARLSEEEHKQIWGSDTLCRGAKWFAKTFPQYRTGTKS